jgi:hypothetical protein
MTMKMMTTMMMMMMMKDFHCLPLFEVACAVNQAISC